jgi:hypothetical protein
MNTTASSSRSPLTFFLLTFARSVPFPNDRSHYDPAVTGPILAAAAVIVTFLRGRERWPGSDSLVRRDEGASGRRAR